MYPLFETLAIINGQIQNIDWHQKRYIHSLDKYYGQKTAVNLTALLANFQIPAKGEIRCRIDYNAHTQKVQFFPYQRRIIRTFQPVQCDHIQYHLKFTDRTLLNQLFTQRGQCDEIMIIKQGYITDCSIGNLIFLRQGEWFTPNTPLLNGTQRQQLLAQSRIQTRSIKQQDLELFEEIRLINALNGL
ncbi:aminotransferase class IV family protein [Conservatibacter flavescens]|uniref:Branched-chain amino acid aminotransferase n=1 Tax=Conservatibacter flavescens TaxID=28161 RepID=A0A2M8S1U0_9PAST|nr:aminotransferase class IV family protein [Conservatibacter flavescens]PJG85095.1 hypothetical protein CVP05_07505 [Conservatibacter flavescens]